MQLRQALTEFNLNQVGKSRETRRWYRRMLAPLLKHLGDVEIEDVAIGDLRRWHRSLETRTTRWGGDSTHPEEQGPLSPWTIRAHLNACKIFFRWLQREGHLERNPAQRLKLPDLPKRPPKDAKRHDMERIIEQARLTGPREYAIVLLFAETAARLAGIASMKLSDLNLTGLEIDGARIFSAWVKEKGRGGGKTRRVFFGDRTAEALRDYLKARPDADTDRLFIGQRGPLTESGIYQMLRRLAKRAGVSGQVNPHAWRHAWAKAALENGADLGTVADVLGHEDISTTRDSYACWNDAELAARHQRFSWLNGQS